MRTNFDQKLSDVHRQLLEMGVLVIRNISNTVEAFNKRDVQLAQEVIDSDVRVNKMEAKIDRVCEQIIAMEQPNTSDLRRIIAILRASSNLERMGDHAQNISEITIEIEDKKRVDELEDILIEMAQIVMKMAEDIIDAFVEFDVDRAREIAKRDKEVNKLYHNLRGLVIEQLKSMPDSVDVLTDYNFAGKYLERIGDYVKNISEGIIYLDTGDVTDL